MWSQIYSQTLDSGFITEPLGEENDPLNNQNTEQSNHQIDQLFPIERCGTLDKAMRLAKQIFKVCLHFA